MSIWAYLIRGVLVNNADAVRSKIRQLYAFLKEATQLRFRPIRSVTDQPKILRLSDMPRHESAQIYRPVQTSEDQEVTDILIRMRRPMLTRCPTPPISLTNWLLPGWDDPAKESKVAESQNITVPRDGGDGEDTITVRFEDDEERPVSLKAWLDRRSSWVTPELAARDAMGVFEVLYDIYSTLEKDGEQLELLAADGHLSWQAISSVDGPIIINHPVLLKRVELRFDANVPEFTIHDTDREPELYGSLFVDLPDVEPAALRNRKIELEASSYHPFGWDDTEAFLRAFIQTVSPLAGEFLDEPGGSANQSPMLWREPMLILRKRVLGIANAVDAIIDNIDQTEVFPPALASITGMLEEWSDSELSIGGAGISDSASAPASNDDEILLAKEANEEQMQIIRRLERSGSVIVQGPPGTGKTHTIGNLIGHLLAQGKSILVTAQTAKALRVVRDKVPETLRPLCVSVLGSDQDARNQLESSIGSITERLTSDTAQTLLNKAANLASERRNLLTKTLQLSHTLKETLENEYREIEVSGRRFSPSEAARHIATNSKTQNWIPAPVKLGTEIILTDEELGRLYELGPLYSAEEQRDAQCALPDLSQLPSVTQFETMVSEYRGLTTQDITAGREWWSGDSDGCKEIEEIENELQTAFSRDLLKLAWRPHAIVAGMLGGTEREAWELLITAINRATEANAKHSLVLHHRPRLSQSIEVHRQGALISEIHQHISAGGNIGFLQLARRTGWRQLIKSVSITAGQPSHQDHFDALKRLAELEVARLDLEGLWNALIGERAGMPFASMMPAPEMSCRALIPEIQSCLDWHKKTWEPIAAKLKAAGLRLDELLASNASEASQIAQYNSIEGMATTRIPLLLSNEVARRRLKECETWFAALADLSSKVDLSASNTGSMSRLNDAARSRNSAAYADALEYARRLHSVLPLVKERGALLAKLALTAPRWADQIAHRQSPHDQRTIPGDHQEAWVWRQLNDTLIERDKLDPHQVQHGIDKNQETLREVTQSLIEANAWGKQLERLQADNSIRQALVGWLDTAKRLISTKQAERRNLLLSEARNLMRQCAAAVPVWIMPISLMAENFDPGTTRFDVVIVDEASQADLNALIPLYMGKQVIVVGDHEQVTPLGVGRDQTILENLRKAMLKDIPNSHLFDNQSSIYDIGRQSFGDAVRLVEHFRCVPEIIAFSNQLSYDGKIRPLREANSTNLKPACVARRVQGVRENDINRGEAESIIATIRAMIKHPAYADKSIGVISMKGNAQAILIQTMLHKELDSVELERRRIQAGISGEFQGDELDVIFLSMVDSSADEGTLRATGVGAFEQTKKRYNVAASRARDQLWVVHSFDPDLNLRSNDLRFQLLRHIKDPKATIRAFDTAMRRTESPFEREVLKRLTAAGYVVRTQWQVGYFRIDMVVEGGGKRLAVECDGDRWHPPEKLAQDIERQTILERLGWQFVRIRGTAFYRNPALAMAPLFDRLNEMGILKGSSTPSPEPVTDMTLVHELDEIIARGFGDETLPDTPSSIDIFGNCEDASLAIMEIPHAVVSANLDHGQVEALLKEKGGLASLDTFLRDLATAAGYQRLGRNIRASLEAELEKLQQKGRITLSDGYIRFP